MQMHVDNMFSHKLWVTVFIPIIIVLINHIDKCKTNLLETVLTKQNAVTGYPEQPVWTTFTLLGLPDGNLKEILDEKLKQLKCGYTFNALHHLNLTKNLLRFTLNSRIINIVTKYKEHIVYMIGTLYENGDKFINIFWQGNYYLNKLENIIEYFDKLENIDTQATIFDLHVQAIGRLMDVIKHCACGKNNKFGQTDLKYYEFAECQNPENELECIDRVEQLVTENSKSIQELLDENTKHGFVLENKELYSVDRLYLNAVVSNTTFTNNITTIFNADIIGLDVVFIKIEEKLKKAQANPNHGLKRIKHYLNTFFDTMLLIILRMTRRCLMFMAVEFGYNSSCLCTFSITGKYEKRKNVLKQLLNKIINFFAMPNDVLKEISTKINNNELGRSSIKFILTEELKIREKYGLRAKPLKLKTSSCVELFNKLNNFGIEEKLEVNLSVIPDSRIEVPSKTKLCLMEMETFYQYLYESHLFDNISFSAIHSFCSARSWQ